MASQSLRIKLQKPFNDHKNYPYGFSRSGDFSIRESQLLQQKGNILKALWEGTLAPESDDEKAFVDMLKGNKAPETTEEKLWVKYLKRINRPHIGALNSGKPDDVEQGDEEVLAVEDDIDVVDEGIDDANS